MKHVCLVEKKASKGFYIKGFHYAVNALMISVVLNCILITLIHNKEVHHGSSHFYATNGLFPAPIELNALNAPNESSVALLANDPPEEMTIRALPENF